MKQIILNGIHLDELVDKISDAVQLKIDQISSSQKLLPKPNYLTRSEVAKLLKISLPTLHEWTKSKLLQSYKIGNRVLYKLDEVENALHKVGSLTLKDVRSMKVKDLLGKSTR